MKKWLAQVLSDTSLRGLMLLTLALLVVAVLVIHLFRFEELVAVFMVIFSVTHHQAIGIGAVIIITELLFVPVLLRMPLNKSLHITGIICGGIMASSWLITGWMAGALRYGIDTGFLGAIVTMSGEATIIGICFFAIIVLLLIPVRR